jgi:hypothetical protein
METPTSVVDIVTSYLLDGPGAAIFVGRSSLEYLAAFADLDLELYALGLADASQPPFRSGQIVFTDDYSAPRWWNGAFPTVIAANLFAEEISASRRLLLTQHLVELLAPGGRLVFSTFDLTSPLTGLSDPRQESTSPSFGFHSLSLELRLLGLELETLYRQQHIGVFRRRISLQGNERSSTIDLTASQSAEAELSSATEPLQR